MLKYRYIFVAIYLVVDLIYVTLSKGTYDNAVKMIQGKSMPIPARFSSALAAYTCMVLGWFFLAAPTAERWSKTMHPALAGFLAGLVYGLLVIGTFNFTLNAMLDNWSGYIFIRDLLWGISWSIIITTTYSIVLSKF